MAVFKCKMCGGTLEIKNNETVATCEYCGTQQTLPKLDDERRANLYDRANHFRRNNEFDKALGIYEQILSEDNTDAEAHWSIILCKYGIEYVEDPRINTRVPTVNRAQFTSIFDDDNYALALKYADGYQEEIYKAEAEVINKIQKGILEISNKEEPFDVFICYKEQDKKGGRTKDSVIAQELYYQLEKEGIRTFFARVTLEDKLGVAYEPYIFAALNSAKVMVVLGTNAENLNSVWVKNEWSRYLALIKKGADKTLIPVYQNMDPYDLPEAFSHLQAQDMAKVGAMQDLVYGIKKLVDVDSKAAAQTAETTTVIVDTMLKRAEQALTAKDWQQATRCYENVLDYDEKNKQAFIGKMLVDFKVSSLEELANGVLSISNHASYKFLTEGLDDETANKLKQVEETIQNRISEIKAAKKAKAKKILRIFLLAILLVAIGVGIYFLSTEVIIPLIKYNSAVKMVNNKQFDEAISQFELLGEYKDSKDKINETYILKGDYLVENGDYDNAIEIYSNIPENREKLNEAYYQKAMFEIKNDHFLLAATILNDNGLIQESYKDSVELWDECYRKLANAKYKENMLFLATDYFEKIINKTEDDKVALNECIYQYALQLYNNKYYTVATKQFKKIIGYKDSQNYFYETEFASLIYTYSHYTNVALMDTYKNKLQPLVDAGYAPAIEEYNRVQSEIDAIKAKETADAKEYADAMAAIEGTWKWKNFFGYYMEIKNGKISYGDQTDRSVDHADESWNENCGTITYNCETNKYDVSFSWAETMTFDGKKIKFFDEYGDPATFFDGYATRYKF